MGRGAREQRDFGKRAARGDPRAMRDFATGKVPLRTSGYTPGSKVISTTGKVLKADAHGTLPSKATIEPTPKPEIRTDKQHAEFTEHMSHQKRLRLGAERFRDQLEDATKKEKNTLQLDKARAAGKKVNEARQKAQQKFPKPKAITQQELMKKTQPITHPPNPKAPAKSIAQTRNANIVNKMFGGSTKITQRGGGGGFGATLSQGTGIVARKPGPGGR